MGWELKGVTKKYLLLGIKSNVQICIGKSSFPTPHPHRGRALANMTSLQIWKLSCTQNSLQQSGSGKHDFSVQICTFHAIPREKYFLNWTITSNVMGMEA